MKFSILKKVSGSSLIYKEQASICIGAPQKMAKVKGDGDGLFCTISYLLPQQKHTTAEFMM